MRCIAARRLMYKIRNRRETHGNFKDKYASSSVTATAYPDQPLKSVPRQQRKDSLLFHRVLCLTSAGAMDLENQKRVLNISEEHGPENVVVLLGAAEAEAAGLAAETVTAGDPTYAGPLAGVQLGLSVYHICEDEVKAETDPAVYEEQVGMMEMVMDVPAIHEEMEGIRKEYCKY